MEGREGGKEDLSDQLCINYSQRPANSWASSAGHRLLSPSLVPGCCNSLLKDFLWIKSNLFKPRSVTVKQQAKQPRCGKQRQHKAEHSLESRVACLQHNFSEKHLLSNIRDTESPIAPKAAEGLKRPASSSQGTKGVHHHTRFKVCSCLFICYSSCLYLLSAGITGMYHHA